MGAQTLGNALARVALTVANRLGGTATLVSPGTSAVSFDSTSGAFVGAAVVRFDEDGRRVERVGERRRVRFRRRDTGERARDGTETATRQAGF